MKKSHAEPKSASSDRELSPMETARDIFPEDALVITGVEALDDQSARFTYVFPKYTRINRDIEHVTAPQIDEAIFQTAFVMFGYLHSQGVLHDLPVTQKEYLKSCHRSIYRMNNLKYSKESFPGEEIHLDVRLQKHSIGGVRQMGVQFTLEFDGFVKGEMMFYVPKFVIWKEYRDAITKRVQNILSAKQTLEENGQEATADSIAHIVRMQPAQIEQLLLAGKYVEEIVRNASEETPKSREKRTHIMRRAWNAIANILGGKDRDRKEEQEFVLGVLTEEQRERLRKVLEEGDD
ncbi:hypothetical protein COU77_01110 [Candidatus Peregrinibacteria bacterium CG10_big_fil_rev_8_21_14_0_10_49_16]|nr:MAG: hypothetical protein COU77_01110 [Candidatus Peregrinibacteria bacterium CG10_big_fil_rev_8_21_14_0_10_49_16]